MKESRSFEELLEEFLPPPSHPLYEQNKRYNIEAEERGNRLAALLSLPRSLAGLRVLDIGCGTGGVSVAFAKRKAIVFSLEPNETHRLLMDLTVARAEKAGVSLSPVIARGERIPFPDRSFDVVILYDVLEHVQEPDAVMNEAARVLRDDGLLFLETPNKFSLPQIVREGHSGLFGVTLLPTRIAAFYVTRVRKVRDRYTVNKIHSYRAVKKHLDRLGLDFVAFNRYRPARHFRPGHPDRPKRYGNPLVALAVRFLSLPVLRDAASFLVTIPDLQTGFFEIVASRSPIPDAIQRLYRLGLRPESAGGSPPAASTCSGR
jgi:2-polyprenyl-3-methyl-5-hydroxy-6-metoxy-1,4-benzoquinol methylase